MILTCRFYFLSVTQQSSNSVFLILSVRITNPPSSYLPFSFFFLFFIWRTRATLLHNFLIKGKISSYSYLTRVKGHNNAIIICENYVYYLEEIIEWKTVVETRVLLGWGGIPLYALSPTLFCISYLYVLSISLSLLLSFSTNTKIGFQILATSSLEKFLF